MSCVSKILEDLLLQVKAISRASRCKVEVEPETKVVNLEIFSIFFTFVTHILFSGVRDQNRFARLQR